MRQARSKRRGFSLIELLVVIGIIAVLISILIPVIGRVKSAAQAADTQQQLSRISAAIERYRGDFHAYPGPFSNTQVTPGTVPLTIGATIGANPTIPLSPAAPISSTENMVVGLVGGIGIAVTAPPGATISSFVFDAARMGKGPQSLNPLNPKQYPSYLDYAPDELKDVNGNGVPEFVDRFQDEDHIRPVLYMRAKTGAPGVVDVAAEINVKQYNPRHLVGYGLSAYPATPTANDTTTPAIPGSYEFFKSSSSDVAPNDSPVQKDGFILISAGRDRSYGTGDDILSYSR